MKVNAVAVQPNFTAKVKNNEYMQNVVQNSNKNELANLKISLSALEKVQPKTVLEINKQDCGSVTIKNLEKNTTSTFKGESEFLVAGGFPFNGNKPVNLPDLLMKISTKGSDEYNKVFNAEPTKEQKAQKEVFDMLA